jgi:hypothetical protein
MYCFNIFVLIFVTNEYGQNTIYSSLIAVPRRELLFVSKTIVSAIYVAVSTFISMTTGFIVVYLFSKTTDGHKADFIQAYTTDIYWHLFAPVIAMILLSVVCVGLAFLLRSSQASIIVYILALLLPGMVGAGLARFLGSDNVFTKLADNIESVFPSKVFDNFIVAPKEFTLNSDFTKSLIAIVLWAGLFAFFGLFSLKKRDAYR